MRIVAARRSLGCDGALLNQCQRWMAPAGRPPASAACCKQSARPLPPHKCGWSRAGGRVDGAQGDRRASLRVGSKGQNMQAAYLPLRHMLQAAAQPLLGSVPASPWRHVLLSCKATAPDPPPLQSRVACTTVECFCQAGMPLAGCGGAWLEGRATARCCLGITPCETVASP